MAEEKAQAKARRSQEKDEEAAVRRLGKDEQARERTPREPRERQHPALYGEDAVEVAERTSDIDTSTAAVAARDDVSEKDAKNRAEAIDGAVVEQASPLHVKDFVALKRDLEAEDIDEVHKRNINAVRQYMVNQGLRPDADVVFAGETDLGGPPGRQSVRLRYEVRAVPAVVATEFDLRHTVIPQDGPTPTERAEFDAKREERLKAGHDAVREGTPEAERPAATEVDQGATKKD